MSLSVIDTQIHDDDDGIDDDIIGRGGMLL